MEDQNNSDKQAFKLDKFEGPLDLLLFLIKKNEVNIYDIPIAQITEQYLRYIELITRIDLERATEFYRLAATLLYIKSRMLLPVEFEVDDEIEDPRRDLVEKLIEYQKYKKLSELMTQKNEETEEFLERKNKEPFLPFPDEPKQWEELSVWDLLNTFSKIISGINTEKILNLNEEVTVNEKISLVYEILDNEEEFSFGRLITRANSVIDVVCAFLALLELVKIHMISVYQNRVFGDIMIRKKQRKEDEIGTGNSLN